jgi:hypothetical protein
MGKRTNLWAEFRLFKVEEGGGGVYTLNIISALTSPNQNRIILKQVLVPLPDIRVHSASLAYLSS